MAHQGQAWIIYSYDWDLGPGKKFVVCESSCHIQHRLSMPTKTHFTVVVRTKIIGYSSTAVIQVKSTYATNHMISRIGGEVEQNIVAVLRTTITVYVECLSLRSNYDLRNSDNYLQEVEKFNDMEWSGFYTVH